jgi:hypothetical protein
VGPYLSFDELVQVLDGFRLKRRISLMTWHRKLSRTLSRTAFISVIATSVFCTRSSSAFSTSNRACSCLAGVAVFKLKEKRTRESVRQLDLEVMKYPREPLTFAWQHPAPDGILGQLDAP